ncbi:MAG: hypothetical protein H7070_05600 [Saprospiraceae bacterium]|nr:hypothetical protein [Pyrinomonadaceae bacterium]
MRKRSRKFIMGSLGLTALLFCGSCKSSGGSGGLLGPADETAEAAQIVAEANKDLTKIKVLYKNNEQKREELKTAMSADDAAAVKKIADDVVYIINDGADFGEKAIEKLQQAQDMEIDPDYKEYLRLKEEALKKHREAFEQYRQAARALRDNYDPKNDQLREKVKLEFKERSENYQKITERARDYSNQANELAKDVLRKKQEN